MRRKTILVKIGQLTLSSEDPVMIQSMLSTSTMDTEACVNQAIRIIETGGQLVRITAQGVKEAENLKYIHAALRERGYKTPLSADIHFNPDAALVAARHVEKVRINPGNFVDKRAIFKNLIYTEEEYEAELAHLRQKFTEFLEVCRQYNTAVRIGTNHGSLSDRIMSRYGNTPAGMVEATMEYLRVCKDIAFNDVVISLKSSDCSIMIDAVRLLVTTMEREGMYYPLHLGVTEAGEGEDGRIRSAIGIGTLLNEGIGDTIRVSLTEEPEEEIPVAKALVSLTRPEYKDNREHEKGLYNKPILVADISREKIVDESVTSGLGFADIYPAHPAYGVKLGIGGKAPEMIYTEALGPELTKLPEDVTVIVDWRNLDLAHVYNRSACPLMKPEEFIREGVRVNTRYLFVEINGEVEINKSLADRLKEEERAIVVLTMPVDYARYKFVLHRLNKEEIKNRVIIKAEDRDGEPERIALRIAAHVGGLFVDRLIYGLWLFTPRISNSVYSLELGRNILQSAGLRRYKTEFVSCPGCGRTLYDLQGAVAKVKEAFSHLNHLKIAIMGCVVNGPGEMGDADYGYVGAGNGKVNLYKGRQVMKVAIPEGEAINQLKQLIIDNKDWADKEEG